MSSIPSNQINFIHFHLPKTHVWREHHPFRNLSCSRFLIKNFNILLYLHLLRNTNNEGKSISYYIKSLFCKLLIPLRSSRMDFIIGDDNKAHIPSTNRTDNLPCI
ncbi:hypothetical protein I7I48_07660 [Histoplasma ohiense]|nr:hypothetical protein I7I48_07660 [Histoplasma ohiense (nom. inval.)]